MPIFRSQPQAALLAWLLLHPGHEYTLTELAKKLDVPLTTLQREAQRLVVAGLLQDRILGRSRLLRANPSNRAAAPLTQLLEVTFGPETVIGEEFDLTNAEQVLIYGSWAERYHGTPGPPPNDVDVLVVADLDRADVYDAADWAQARLGMQVNPVIRTPDQWANDADSLVFQIKASPTVDVTAILAQQGLRPTTSGGHYAVEVVLRAHFGDGFRPFGAMRRRRNELEDPTGPGETTAHDEAQKAIQDAKALLMAAQQLLSTLSIF
jgi:hypothetical protein